MDYYGLMLHILRILATFLPGALVASACFAAPPQTPQHQTAAPGDRPIASALLDATLFYEILLGEIVTREGDPGTGYALVLEAARRSNDERLFQRATDIALQARAGDQALAAAQVVLPVLQLGLPDAFIEHGDPAKLLSLQGLDAAGIQASIARRFPA